MQKRANKMPKTQQIFFDKNSTLIKCFFRCIQIMLVCYTEYPKKNKKCLKNNLLYFFQIMFVLYYYSVLRYYKILEGCCKDIEAWLLSFDGEQMKRSVKFIQ